MPDDKPLTVEYRHRAHDTDGNLVWREGRAGQGWGDFYSQQAWEQHHREQRRYVTAWEDAPPTNQEDR